MILHEATTAEKAYLRTEGQASRLAIAGLVNPPTVFSARVNQSFSTRDMVAEITYDGAVGDYTDVLPGMTMWVGSAAGLYDIGQVRIRKAATSTVLYIGEESDVNWDNNLYLTVVDEMGLWPKHVRMVAGVPKMDYDIAYSDQHSVFDPIPRMECDAVVDLKDALSTGNIVTNGAFTTDTTGWTAGTDVILSVVSGAMHINRNGAATINHAYQDVTTVVGQVYRVSVKIVSYSHEYKVYVGGVLLFDDSEGTGTKRFSFTATDTTTRIGFQAIGNANATLDVDTVNMTSATTVLFNASGSSVFGSSISGYAFTSNGGTLVDANTSTPELLISSYPTNGLIRVKLVVTAANGKTATAYRYVHVYDEDHRPFVFDEELSPYSAFEVGPVDGDYDSGGFSFDVIAYGNYEDVRDRAKVILFSEDWYGGTKVSISQMSRRSNIIAIGWIDGESIEYNHAAGSVQFTVQGPQFWFEKMPGFPPGVEIKKAGVAEAWTTIPSLTVDRALWHLLHWRSTATAVMDVYLTDDTKLASAFEVPTESLWQQMVEIAETSILAHPCCDQYNTLYVEINQQLIILANRHDEFPNIMEIEERDWAEQIDIRRAPVDEVSMVDLSGVSVKSDGKGLSWFSLANGHIFKRYGNIEVADRLLLSSQAQANILSGLMIGQKNNPYPEFNINLAQNNRLIGICPRQYVSIDIAAEDTVRGIAYAGYLIPRGVSFQFNKDIGAMTTSLRCEAETFQQISINGDIPPIPPEPPEPPTPPTPPTPPPPVPPGPVGDPTDVLIAGYNSMETDAHSGLYYTENFDDADPEWHEMNEGLTEEEYANVVRIKKCPSGLILIAILSGAYIKSIYYATALGDVWTLLIDDSMVGQGSYSTPAICGFGVNPNKNEEILVVGGGYDGIADGHKKSYIGDRSGLTEIDGDLDITNQPGDISYALGKWLLTTSRADALSRASWTTFNADGTVIANNIYSTAMAYQAFAFHQRRAGKVFLPVSSLGDYMRVISNNDPTPEVIWSLPIGYGLSSNALAVSPSGLKMICGEPNTASYKSIDGGENWEALAGIGSYNRAWENCDVEDAYIGVAGQNIEFTDDFGVTWSAKNGNLASINNLYIVSQIKYIAG